MKFKIFNRKFHRWASIVTALPILIVIGSGLLLQVKKESDWVQPPTQQGTGAVPSLGWDALLARLRADERTGIRSWADIDRIDVRPDKGVIKVVGHDGLETQLDATTGEVLQVAVRRSDVIEAIHDGSWFHESAKLWLFLPVAVVLALLWLTGVYLFFVQQGRRRKRSGLSPD